MPSRKRPSRPGSRTRWSLRTVSHWRDGARLRCLIAPLMFGCNWTGLRPCVAARVPIVDAEENRYYISLEGDLYLYVVPPEPQHRFLLCPSIVPRIRRKTHNTSGRPLPGEEAMSLSPASHLLPRVRGPVSTTRLLPGVVPSFLGLVLFRLSLICLPIFGCCVAVLDCCACCRSGIIDRTKSVSDKTPPRSHDPVTWSPIGPRKPPRKARRGGDRKRGHLGCPRRHPPLPRAIGMHDNRPLLRDSRPPTQKLTDVAHGRRPGARPELRAGAPTPAPGRRFAAGGDDGEFASGRQRVSSSLQGRAEAAISKALRDPAAQRGHASL
jgi:hypothetical protein